jgi:allophanate hydrolase subunit 1
MRPLYEIAIDLKNITDLLYQDAEENDGEINENLENMLNQLSMEREQKIGQVCKLYKNMLAESEMVKAEEKKLSDRRKRLENKAASIKSFLAGFVVIDETYSDSISKISWRKSESTEVFDISKIPKKYLNIEYTPNKTDIKAAILSGEIIEGAKILQNKNMQIK